MKNESIRNAWDTVNPTGEQKDRMRQNLLAQIPEKTYREPTVYQARAVRTNRWSVLTSAAACIAVLLLGSFVLPKLERPESMPQQQTAPMEKTEPSIPSTEDTEPTAAGTEEAEPLEPTQPQPVSSTVPFGPGDYLTYVTWIRQRNQTDPYFNRDTTQYYAYYDINGDGIRELLIGGEDGWISEAITCIDGELSLLFSVGRDFRICEDGSLYTGKEEENHFVWYRLSGGEQLVTMTVWYDTQNKSWYQYHSLTGIKKTVTKQTVEELLASCEPVELEMRSLNVFQPE